ncbi:hypothetical protein PPL_03147 [Heterostelium album PN500]|uniref:Uncharacterized protein n=1 Tax=Heterostelium pallidum (strain ATCC 26659 / Pp 5 / PN500) TaxID=670386 RepID=D3B426_HETP5|nr:hypothetical protein PPL_03147 [Heterostelium album PN500]EFA84074.1 hypothetical protein PPL_03147 [Heterostelium album PN500]|eukprot:XP_020436191.1 hypothetical protein PPL_03147 [Heterostelium album PN500]
MTFTELPTIMKFADALNCMLVGLIPPADYLEGIKVLVEECHFKTIKAQAKTTLNQKHRDIVSWYATKTKVTLLIFELLATFHCNIQLLHSVEPFDVNKDYIAKTSKN